MLLHLLPLRRVCLQSAPLIFCQYFIPGTDLPPDVSRQARLGKDALVFGLSSAAWRVAPRSLTNTDAFPLSILSLPRSPGGTIINAGPHGDPGGRGVGSRCAVSALESGWRLPDAVLATKLPHAWDALRLLVKLGKAKKLQIHNIAQPPSECRAHSAGLSRRLVRSVNDGHYQRPRTGSACAQAADLKLSDQFGQSASRHKPAIYLTSILPCIPSS
jgi:hypothetical protein